MLFLLCLGLRDETWDTPSEAWKSTSGEPTWPTITGNWPSAKVFDWPTDTDPWPNHQTTPAASPSTTKLPTASSTPRSGMSKLAIILTSTIGGSAVIAGAIVALIIIRKRKNRFFIPIDSSSSTFKDLLSKDEAHY